MRQTARRKSMSVTRRRALAWDDQQAFLAVIEEGSLSGAARRLSITQPTVRARVAALEAALGTALFTRSAGGMVPTRQAQALADHARAMQRASDALVRASSGVPGAVVGTVRISVSEFVGIELLPPMLAELRAEHPGLCLELVLSNRNANLLEQEVDVAVRMAPPSQQALIVSKVAAIPLGLFAHERYLAGRPAVRELDDLVHHDVVGPDRSREDLALLDRLLPGFPPDRLVLRTDSHPAQLAAARAGLGIAFAQVPAARRSPGLVRVLPELAIGVLDTWLVTHEDLRHVPRVRAVIDHLARAFRDPGQL